MYIVYIFIYKNMAGLLDTLKFLHKISTDIIKFVCSSVELVRKVRRLQFHRYLQWLEMEAADIVQDVTIRLRIVKVFLINS